MYTSTLKISGFLLVFQYAGVSSSAVVSPSPTLVNLTTSNNINSSSIAKASDVIASFTTLENLTTTSTYSSIATETSGLGLTPDERDVSPSFFYGGPMIVVCPGSDAAYKIILSILVGDIKPDPGRFDITERSWNIAIKMWGNQVNKPDAVNLNGGISTSLRQTLSQVISQCRHCLCDQETGRILPKPGNKVHNCKSSQWFADRCAIGYGCYCAATLAQPVLDAATLGEPLENFQRAIDAIPRTVRGLVQNRGWVWNVDPRIARVEGETMTFTGGPLGDPNLPVGRIDVADPDDPPFYLYPNSKDGEDPGDDGAGSSGMGLFGMGGLGGLDSLAGGSYKKSKRDTHPADEDGRSKGAAKGTEVE
ncbi:hypothetical protein TWF281_003263 [Arthrobotrys megalospora]